MLNYDLMLMFKSEIWFCVYIQVWNRIRILCSNPKSDLKFMFESDFQVNSDSKFMFESKFPFNSDSKFMFKSEIGFESYVRIWNRIWILFSSSNSEFDFMVMSEIWFIVFVVSRFALICESFLKPDIGHAVAMCNAKLICKIKVRTWSRMLWNRLRCRNVSFGVIQHDSTCLV
jgi:hypothetical protein